MGMNSKDYLVLRWTVEQREQACAIVNDIAEDIDNHESRRELRQALAIYADMLYDEQQQKMEKGTAKLLADLKTLANKLNQPKPI